MLLYLKREMRAGDIVLEKIYEKVITTDCYLHSYQQITLEEIEKSKLIIYITDNKVYPPSYLYSVKSLILYVGKCQTLKKPS